MTRPLRVALVGCGAVSTVTGRGYGPVAGLATVVATVDRRFDRAEALAATIGARPFATLDDALRNLDVDCVDVRVPHVAHAEVALEAITAGKHVLVEKPLAADVADARQLVEQAARAGVVLAVAENYSFFEPVTAAARLLAEGAIGEVLTARTNRVAALGGVWLQDGWRLDRERAGGGVLIDQGCHFTNILRRTLGEIVAVQAMTSSRAPGWGVEDSAVVNCRFESGLIGQQFFTFASPTPGVGAEAYFYGTAGSLEIHTGYGAPTGGLLLLEPGGGPGRWVVDGINYDDTFAPTIEDWLRACLGERAPRMSGVEGLRDLEVVAAAYRSAASGAEEPVG